MNAAMRRKDFELIVAALNDVRHFINDPAAEEHHNEVVRMLAVRMKEEYPAFDRERFLRDCGVQP